MTQSHNGFDSQTMSALLRLHESARNLADVLFEQQLRVVFAESCTCGMCAAALGQVPGISAHLSGSAVTYRPQVKMDWLNVDPAEIAEFTTESAEITAAMARGVLQSTSDPQVSAATTGHLGPVENAAIDGRIFITIAQRTMDGISVLHEASAKLSTNSRAARQAEAATRVLTELCVALVSSRS